MACCQRSSAAAGLAVAALLGAAAPRALALSPSDLFEKVSPSVWAVRTLDLRGQPFGNGSAVVIGPGRLITNCHVLAKAKTIELRREGVKHEAKLEHADAERDLCTLTAAGLAAPAVAMVGMAQLKIGQRVYAIGNPKGLALTLSEGLISGLRSEDPELPPIQTSAPISPGSSGGGLFDEQGRLVGITTAILNDRTRLAQNLNFATPAAWIAEVPERAKQQLARLRAQQAAAATLPGAAAGAAASAPAAEGMPGVGTKWTYALRDERYGGPEKRFSISVASVSGSTLRESFDVPGADPAQLFIEAREVRFHERRLPGGASVVELIPYFVLARSLPPGLTPTRYPGGTPIAWKVGRLSEPVEEEVTVPAGTYRTVRVQVSGVASTIGTTTGDTSRFTYTAWYAEDIKRYVKTRHQTWNRANAPVSDEIVQLVEYRPQALETAAAAPAAALAKPAWDAPPVGTSWRYAFRDEHLRRREEIFTVEVAALDGWEVRETFTGPDRTPVSLEYGVKDVRFLARKLPSGNAAVELSPYLYASDPGRPTFETPTRYPLPRTWKISAPRITEEEITVPAGKFKTTKVVLTGDSNQFGHDYTSPMRFTYTIWYAPDIRRYVMSRHETWSRVNAKVGDETVKLLEYRAARE